MSPPYTLLIVAIFHFIVEENFVNLKYLCKGGVRILNEDLHIEKVPGCLIKSSCGTKDEVSPPLLVYSPE